MYNIRRMSKLLMSRNILPWLVFIIVYILMSIVNNSLFTPYAISSIFESCTPIFLMTAGSMIVMLVGSIDLTLATTVGFTSCLTAGLLVYQKLPIAISVLIVLFAGAVIGFINGFIIAKARLQSFIVTIAMSVVIKGFTLIYTKGSSIPNIPDNFINIFVGKFLGIQRYFYIGLSILIIITILLKVTRFGRYLYAVGGNETAARSSGLPVDSLRIRAFVLAGIFYAMAGIILASQFGSGWPQAANGWEMDGIAAAILGGASFTGGTGLIVSAIAGTFSLDLITKFLLMIGISTYWQYVTKGIFVVIVSTVLARGKYGR